MQKFFKRIFLNPYSALIVAMIFWAGATVLVRYIRDVAPPMGLSFWRQVVAFLILFPFTFQRIRSQFYLVRAHWKTLVLLAMLLWFGGNALLFLALQFTIAINAAVINSVEPILIVFFAWLIFRDQFSRLQAVGAVISLFGVLVLIASGSLEELFLLNFDKGDIIVLCAFMGWALYAVFLRKLPRELDPLVLVTILVGFGVPMLLPFYLIETAYFKVFEFDLLTMASIFYLATFAGAISMLNWNYGLIKLGPARAGQFLHLIPAFTVVMAITLLDEELRYFHIVGIILIGIGIYLTSRSANTKPN